MGAAEDRVEVVAARRRASAGVGTEQQRFHALQRVVGLVEEGLVVFAVVALVHRGRSARGIGRWAGMVQDSIGPAHGGAHGSVFGRHGRDLNPKRGDGSH